MKGSIAFVVLISLSSVSVKAQSLLSNPSLSVSNVGHMGTFSPSIVFNADQDQRFNQFAYNNFKIDGVQVISVYEPNLQQDRVYFIDKYGNSRGWTLRPSSPANTLRPGYGGSFDSLNPNGANGIFEALAFGALNSLFSGKASKVLFK